MGVQLGGPRERLGGPTESKAIKSSADLADLLRYSLN